MRNLSKSFLILLVILMVVAIPISSVNAQAIIGTGLEVEKPEIYVIGTGLEVEKSEIFVLITANISGDNDNNKINISEALIRSKVELRLRQNDIKVLNKINYYPDLINYCPNLKVRVHILEDELFCTYLVELSFRRVVEYNNTNYKTYFKSAKVWTNEGFGRGRKEDIINCLEDYTDIFINEFYKANDF